MTDRALCPECQGGGEVTDPRDRGMHPADPDVRTMLCPSCLGDEVLHVSEVRRIARRRGWAQAEIADWIAKGVQSR